MKIYTADRKKYDRDVVVSTDSDQYIINVLRSQKLRNHSPDGFEWGYGGSGPSQLSLAILLDFTDDEEFSLNHYQQFKFDIIAKKHHDGWALSGDEISLWIKDQKFKKVQP